MLLTRRRFLVTAAACGLPLAASAEAPAPFEWSGLVMGGIGTVRLYHPDAEAAADLLGRVAAEARRLERIFSLYDRDSELSRLNREGVLVGPSAEMVDLLGHAARISRLTGGAFDPTVQPLWELYAAHFSGEDADPRGPSDAAIRAALARIGHGRVHAGPDRVALDAGSALTLNGIAQGYITDRVVTLLRGFGVTRALVDMGEPRAIGRPPARAWQVGIADPRDGRRIAQTLSLEDRAAATSGAYGFQFVPGGPFNHLFDPRTGRCADPARSLTVLAPDATSADGLSTALVLMPEQRIRDVVADVADIAVLLLDRAGAATVIGTV